MRKVTILMLVIFTLLSINSKSQTWTNVGNGIHNGSVFVMTEYNSELIVGGVFNNAGNISSNNIAKWDGTIWSNLGTGVNGDVLCFTIFNNDLYVGGNSNLTNAGGIPVQGIAKWNGSNWVNIPAIAGTASINVESMVVYNNELYASVGLTVSGAYTMTLYKFNGTSWSVVGAVGNGAYSANISSLKVYNGNLYVAGEFSTINGNSFNNIAKWNGTTWTSVGIGIPLSTTSKTRHVWDMEIFNGELCIGGEFNFAGGIPVNNIAKWDGINWAAMGSGCNYTIIDLEAFNTDLCVGGYYNIEKWDGMNWSTLGNQLFVTAHALCAYNNVIFAGGNYWDQVVSSSTIYNIGQLSNITLPITLIPDINFELALINLGLDSGSPNGSVPTANIDTVVNLNVISSNISDLTGIQDFSSLSFLDCYDNQLTSLNMSQNNALTKLYCNSNELVNLDVSQNPLLYSLWCHNNQLMELNVSPNNALRVLACYNNQLNCLNTKNGNNINFTYFNSANNTSLSCIEVDNVAWANTNWSSYKDSWATFSSSCIGNCGSVGVVKFIYSSMTISPNPTKDIITISNGQGNYIITDVFGRIVKEVNITSNNFQLNTNNFKSGIYFLISKEDNSTIKFIKQ